MVLADMTPGQPAYEDEMFDPVASIIRAKNDEDAMQIANRLRGDTLKRARKLVVDYFEPAWCLPIR